MTNKIRTQLTAAKKRKIMEAVNHKCEIKGCKSKAYEIHHIKPVSKGGTNTTGNLIVLCANCHKDVHDGKILLKTIKDIISKRTASQKSFITKTLQNVKKSKEKGFWDKATDWFNNGDDDF